MRNTKISICMFLVFTLLAPTLSLSIGTAPAREVSEYAPGEVIIGLEAITSDIVETLQTMGGKIIEEISALNALVVEVTVGNEDAFIQSASRIAGVRYAERNGIYKAVYTPNDTYWDHLWNMRIIEADTAWDTEKGSTSIVIAIVDTGIDYNHPDLAAHYVSGGYDWVNNDNDPMDGQSHGTHCAGIAAAVMDNQLGVVGVAQCSLWAEKVLNDEDPATGDWDDLANGILHATDNGVEVISMSLGGYGYSSLVDDACTYAWDHGVLLVAAAGNDNLNMDINPHYPASFETVIAVSATDDTDNRWSWSNYGSAVELAAPGVNIFSTNAPLGGDLYYAYKTGTSMACPHVSGVAALLWSYAPSLTNGEVRECLHTAVDDLGTPGIDIYYGYGRINARKALLCQPPLPHHFLFEGYIDELWLSLNADGTVNGYDVAPGVYVAPVLGMWRAGGGMLLFLDFPSELMMLIVRFPSLTGTGWFTADGLSVIGPYSYQLIYVSSTETSEGAEGKVLAAREEASEVQPRLVGFYLMPYMVEEWFGTFSTAPLGLTGILGYAFVEGSDCYPAPHLGIKTGGQLIFADAFAAEACYALRLNIVEIATLTGTSYATYDGLEIVGVVDFWLEPM